MRNHLAHLKRALLGWNARHKVGKIASQGISLRATCEVTTPRPAASRWTFSGCQTAKRPQAASGLEIHLREDQSRSASLSLKSWTAEGARGESVWSQRTPARAGLAPRRSPVAQVRR